MERAFISDLLRLKKKESGRMEKESSGQRKMDS
jgi:hypothetical protein